MSKLADWQEKIKGDLLRGGLDDDAAEYVALRLGDTSQSKRDAAAEGDPLRKKAAWHTGMATAPARKTTRPPSTSTSKGARTFAALQAFSAEFWKQRQDTAGGKP